jgi:hypothetical protein
LEIPPFYLFEPFVCVVKNKFRVENHLLAVCANKLIVYLNMYTITIKRRINKAFIIILKGKVIIIFCQGEFGQPCASCCHVLLFLLKLNSSLITAYASSV